MLTIGNGAFHLSKCFLLGLSLVVGGFSCLVRKAEVTSASSKKKGNVAISASQIEVELKSCLDSLRMNRAKMEGTEFPFVHDIKNTSRNLVVIGDIHGSLKSLNSALVAAGLVRPEIVDFKTQDLAVDTIEETIKWIGKDTTLVFTGDLINKRDHSVKVIKTLLSLERQVNENPAFNSQVIALAGNHEVGFMLEFDAGKYDMFYKELKKFVKDGIEEISLGKKSLESCELFTPDVKEVLDWIPKRPLVASVNGVFLSHSGFKDGNTLKDISEYYQEFLQDPLKKPKKVLKKLSQICGNGDDLGGLVNRNVFWRDWQVVPEDIEARQIIFGHDPSAFKSRNMIEGYFANQSPNTPPSGVIKVDVGMWEWEAGEARCDRAPVGTCPNEVAPKVKGQLLRCNKLNWHPNGGCREFEVIDFSMMSNSPLQIKEPTTLKIQSGQPEKKEKPAAHSGC